SEENNCANSVLATSINDHYTYGGITLSCEDSFAVLPNDAVCLDFNGKQITCTS
ncbi:hypothetical protein HK096_011344, partial [Nowakowskiella sp. JEL0078]